MFKNSLCSSECNVWRPVGTLTITQGIILCYLCVLLAFFDNYSIMHGVELIKRPECSLIYQLFMTKFIPRLE